MNKRLGTLLSSIGLTVVAATLSAGQLPHTGPGPSPRKSPPAPCNFTSRCAPAPVPCQVFPRQAGCRGGQLPPTGNR